ncbi:glyoxalase [Rhodococcus sp. NM-2]|uniref:glyoxalase n=1 Tax=Rhodococcus sp. NM-2 TaxID=3401174 RepID=UPI003AAA5727
MSTIDTRSTEAVTTTATTFGSTADLTSALIRAAIAHGEHETRTGAADPNWPDWYAAYMVAEQAGTEPPL